MILANKRVRPLNDTIPHPLSRGPPQRRQLTLLSALRTFPLSGESPLSKGTFIDD